MKTLLTILFFGISFAHATTIHYLSSSTGSDSNDGLNVSTPWQTLGKLSSLSPAPGDIILLKRGDTFYGPLPITNSGTSGSQIVYGTYGTGANPIITGLVNVTSWTNLGSNIWESTSAVSTLSTLHSVVINNILTPMGRTPNIGTYYQISSGSTSSLTSSSLSAATTNWTGAEVVLGVTNYTMNKAIITSATDTTLNFAALSYTAPVNNYFFLQNDLRTLDQQNEWYYNPSTKKIDVYSTSSPTGVQIASRDTLVANYIKNFILYDSIDFLGVNTNIISMGSSKGVTFKGCRFSYAGEDAFYGENYAGGNYSNHDSIINCNFTDNNQDAIFADNYFKELYVSGNTFRRTGMILGAASNSEPQATSIDARADSLLIQYNNIDSSGYIGIAPKGNGSYIQFNTLKNYCYNRDDGGGIYEIGSYTTHILNNYCFGGHTNSELAYNQYGAHYQEGIYLDDLTANVEIGYNTCTGNGESGIYLHRTNNISVHNNTCYDNADGQFLIRGTTNITNLSVLNNSFISKSTGEEVARYYDDSQTAVKAWGTFSNNSYSRPLDDNTSTSTIQTVIGGSQTLVNLSGWQTYSLLDANSVKSPKNVSTADSLTLFTNTTTAVTTTPISDVWYDPFGKSYYWGNIVLQPYTSVLLTDNLNILPVNITKLTIKLIVH